MGKGSKNESDPSFRDNGCIVVKGAREHNLKDVNVSIPRGRIIAFTGVSGSGKSSLALGVIHAEAERRYLESVTPYARRLFDQLPAPDVESISGLPPSVALRQRNVVSSARSTLGSLTVLGNLLRMLFSRGGAYVHGQSMLEAEMFSPNTASGACPECHGIGEAYDATEESMVEDGTLTIRQRAVAAWPTAWHGQNLRDMLVSRGIDVDVPWKDLPKQQRQWILFTEERPTIPVYAGLSPAETRAAIRSGKPASYTGTFISARRHLLQSLSTSSSAVTKKRAARYLVTSPCPLCAGKQLRKESLGIKFAGYDIADISRLSLTELSHLFDSDNAKLKKQYGIIRPEQNIAARQIIEEFRNRLATLLELGLGHLSLSRSARTLSSGELQRARIATQVHADLFGIVYVLDEPAAGLHAVDVSALLSILRRMNEAGNTLLLVEHDLDLVREADWIVDIGPAAGVNGGNVLYNGPIAGLSKIESSKTRRHLFSSPPVGDRITRAPSGLLKLTGITHNNLNKLEVEFPLGVLIAVTGVSGSGKSSLVTQALPQLLSDRTKAPVQSLVDDEANLEPLRSLIGGRIVSGGDSIKRVLVVNQRPIGRTPRSNIATYTGVFDHLRHLYGNLPASRSKRWNASHFSFNLPQGRCEHCRGEGQVQMELLFLPSVYTACPVCKGARYNSKVLRVKYRGYSIADVLDMTVDEVRDLFCENKQAKNILDVLVGFGLGYLKLGQPAPQLSGGEAQRIKLASEMQRTDQKGVLYLLDEPTTGLHPEDAETLVNRLHDLVDAGATVIVVEHDWRVILQSDWIVDLGPGAGPKGGTILATGTPITVARNKASITGSYISSMIGEKEKTKRTRGDRETVG